MRISLLLAAVSALCVPMLGADPAQAQASRTWVSGVGDDANPCSRTAPCKTFAGAISKTAANGIINCLDPGGFGAVTITKSITIDCDNTQGSILAAATNGVNVNGAGIVVTLRGLAIEGFVSGLVGVNILQASRVYIEKCRITGFQSGAAQGIRHVPSAGGNLSVVDTIIWQNGLGILTDPAAGNSLITLDRVQLIQNGEGFRAAGTGAGTIFASIQNSVASSNGTNGFNAISPAGGAAVNVSIQRSSSNLHGAGGIVADGTNARVFIGTSMVTGNTTGFSQLNSGQIRSYGNNTLDDNTSNGASTAPSLAQL